MRNVVFAMSFLSFQNVCYAAIEECSAIGSCFLRQYCEEIPEVLHVAFQRVPLSTPVAFGAGPCVCALTSKVSCIEDERQCLLFSGVAEAVEGHFMGWKPERFHCNAAEQMPCTPQAEASEALFQHALVDVVGCSIEQQCPVA